MQETPDITRFLPTQQPTDPPNSSQYNRHRLTAEDEGVKKKNLWLERGGYKK